MISKGKYPNFRYLIILGLMLIFILSSCSTQQNTGTATPGASADQDQFDLGPIMNCPSYATSYLIHYSYHAELDLDPGTGDTFNLEWQSKSPSDIGVWINEYGDITPVEDNKNIVVEVAGEFVYSDSKKCPVQKLTGEWEQITEVSGDCANGKAVVFVTHKWVNTDLESNCGEIPPMIEDFYSSSEEQLFFKLFEDFPAWQINYGEGSFYHVIHSYHFARDPDFLELLPLTEGE